MGNLQVIHRLLECIAESGQYHASFARDRTTFSPKDGRWDVLIWRTSEEEVQRAVMTLRRTSTPALGSGARSGLALLCVHLQEALDTYEGSRGELTYRERVFTSIED